MRITELSETPEGVCSFRVHGAHDSLLNAIRRTMLCDLPAPAISQVEVSFNNSPFPDDYLAHRLGLIPLSCSDYEVVPACTFQLEVEGPADVLSDSLRSDTDACVAQKGVFLCKLREGQRLSLKAECELGTGQAHARFMQAVAPRYARRHEGVEFAECMCLQTPHDSMCKRCGNRKPTEEACARPLTHVFTFETTGGIGCRELLSRVFTRLEQRTRELKDACGRVSERVGGST